MNLPEEKDYESANNMIARVNDLLSQRADNIVDVANYDVIAPRVCMAWRQWDEYVHNLRFKHMLPKGHLGYTEADRKIDLDMKTAPAVRIRDSLGDLVMLLKQRIDLFTLFHAEYPLRVIPKDRGKIEC